MQCSAKVLTVETIFRHGVKKKISYVFKLAIAAQRCVKVSDLLQTHSRTYLHSSARLRITK